MTIRKSLIAAIAMSAGLWGAAATAQVYATDEVMVACTKCGNLLDVLYDWDRARPPASLRDFEQRWSERHVPLR